MVSYLDGLLTNDIYQIIGIENENVDNCDQSPFIHKVQNDCSKLHHMCTKQCKSPDMAWTDFVYKLGNDLRQYLALFEVSTFEQLSDIIISDQIKKKVSLAFLYRWVVSN